MDPIQLEDDWHWEKSGEGAWSTSTNFPAEVSSDKTRMAAQNQSWVPATGEVAPLLPQL